MQSPGGSAEELGELELGARSRRYLGWRRFGCSWFLASSGQLRLVSRL